MMDFTGLDTMLQQLTALEARVVPAAVDAIDAETELILFHSQPLVPVDTGALLASGETRHAQVAGGAVIGEVRYGGGHLDYAIVVHEDTSMRHPRGGKSHYLSQPFYEATATMLEHFAETIAKRLGRLGGT